MRDDPQSNWHTYEIDSNENPSEAVVRAVAAVTNQQLHELAPLHETIDPDALDSLLIGTENGSDQSMPSITFVFGGCEIHVDTDVVRVRESEDNGQLVGET